MGGKLLVPIALGLSLATASALLLYYFLRKDKEEEVEQTDSRQVKSARSHVIEVSVPKNVVAALIGRGGSNIKDIEKKSGVSIIFKKFPEKDADVCLIRGKAQNAQLAETLVHEFIKNQPLIEEDSISVPAWACGRIIGTGGESINDISHSSGARVKVESTLNRDNTGQRLVTFRGTRAQIIQAKDMVQKIVTQQKCLREIDQSKSPRVAATEPQSPSEPGDANSVTHVKQPSKRPGGVGGATIEVYVSAVSSPSRFWVQFVGAQVTQLDALVEEMTEYYQNKDNREQHAISQVSVGQVVAAVFRHDGRWYRARVVDLRPNEFSQEQQVADVFFLDYGDSEYVATHELCELRADLLRLRFQAMECFLAGVRPAGAEEEVVGVTSDGQRWDKWNPKAIQRFEELTKVARWKSLMSVTCTYKRCASAEGERDKEIPGIKLFDITDEGEIDVGGVLVEEGWAVETPLTPRASPRPSPRPTAATSPAPTTPFGDLGASRVLGLIGEGGGDRAESLPHDRPRTPEGSEENRDPHSPTVQALSYPDLNPRPQINGSHDFLNSERQSVNHKQRQNEPSRLGNEPSRLGNEPSRLGNDPSSMDGLSLNEPSLLSDRQIHMTNDNLHSPMFEELKANINRLDSHHDLQSVGASHQHGK